MVIGGGEILTVRDIPKCLLLVRSRHILYIINLTLIVDDLLMQWLMMAS